jgi:hypothetical protein
VLVLVQSTPVLLLLAILNNSNCLSPSSLASPL